MSAMTKDQVKELLKASIAESETWLSQADRELAMLYPKGTKVEVQINRNQHNWTPGLVVDSYITSYANCVHGCVMVKVQNAGKGVRTVGLDRIRHMQ